jgi:hypothetical protein
MTLTRVGIVTVSAYLSGHQMTRVVGIGKKTILSQNGIMPKQKEPEKSMRRL